MVDAPKPVRPGGIPAEDTVYAPIISNKRPGDDASDGSEIPVGGQSGGLPRGLGVAFAVEGDSGGAPWYGSRQLKQQVWDRLQPQCWLNWSWCDDMGRPAHTPMVWSLDPAHKSGPAAFWVYYAPAPQAYPFVLFGNEPDQLEQGNVTPQAAVGYVRGWMREYAGLWAGFGTVWRGMTDPWLETYLDAGGPVPPVWQWHVYPYGSNDTFANQVNAMHTWMGKRGIVRPVLITECSHRSNTVADQVRMLDEAIEALTDGRVQAVYWFAPHFGHFGWETCSLVTSTGALTALGTHFVESRARVRV